jgi:hypothetical protein
LPSQAFCTAGPSLLVYHPSVECQAHSSRPMWRRCDNRVVFALGDLALNVKSISWLFREGSCSLKRSIFISSGSGGSA